MSINETTSSHYLSSEPRFRGKFTAVDSSSLEDPAGVRVDIIDPGGNTTTFVYATDVEVVKESVGVYYIDVLLDQLGQWEIWFTATGSNANSDRHFAKVQEGP